MKRSAFIVILALVSATGRDALAQARSSTDTPATGVGWPELGAYGPSYVNARAPLVRSIRADSSSVNHRRATLAGGLVGGMVGGLAAAAYVLNATAYHCVTVGPACSYDRHTTRRVVTITAGSFAGAALGAIVGHTVARR